MVNFPIREINLSRPKKSVKWHAQSLEFFLSNLQYCLFMFGTVFKIIRIRCSFLSKSATVITKGAKILWKWHIFKLRLLALYWTCLCETTTSNTKRTWILWTGTNYFCLFSICGAKLKKLKGVESTLLQHLGLFLKAGGMNQKKKNAMLLPFSRGSKRYPSFGPVSLHLWEKRGPSSQGIYG